MKHDWKAAGERMEALFKGETPDRVPFMLLACEATGARVTGLTLREMLSSPKRLADASIMTYEFFGTDNVDTVTPPYAGPFEGLAFAKVNGKADQFVWFDYKAPHMPEGRICETERDIENLEIPDHSKVEPWPTIFKAMAIIAEKTGMPPVFCPSLTWSNIQLLRGGESYRAVRERPELLLKLCEKVYESHIDFHKAFTAICGKPSQMFNCQYAFNKHMLSFEDAWRFEGQFVARYCRETDAALIVHNCGFEPYWEEMIDRFLEEGIKGVGVNGSHPLDLDYWVKFNERYPDIVIMGATIYVNEALQTGTPEEVMEKGRQVVQTLGRTKKLALCPLCCLDWRMSLPNIFALRAAVETYGKYPIS